MTQRNTIRATYKYIHSSTIVISTISRGTICITPHTNNDHYLLKWTQKYQMNHLFWVDEGVRMTVSFHIRVVTHTLKNVYSTTIRINCPFIISTMCTHNNLFIYFFFWVLWNRNRATKMNQIQTNGWRVPNCFVSCQKFVSLQTKDINYTTLTCV